MPIRTPSKASRCSSARPQRAIPDICAHRTGKGIPPGGSISAGMTVIVDGTEQTQERLERLLRTDPGIGVIRHADAGYESALATVRETDLVAPMLEHRDGAQGPGGEEA